MPRSLLVAIVSAAFLACGVSPPEYDLLIVNGAVLDGTGSPERTADVAIRNGAIEGIGSFADRTATRVLDARGRIVSPGFIDMMGGSSLPLLTTPRSAESKLRQGITTMMAGEGASLAPQDERTFAELADSESGELASEWRSFDEYFRLLEAKGIALNVVHNVGAAQVRRIVLGDEDVAPDGVQIAEMKRLVEEAMRDGAVGLSSSLIYPPGTYATTEELIELARAAAAHHGVYFSHMRNESGGLLDAIEEALTIGRKAGIPVHIYHLKAAGQGNWPLMASALERITAARNEDMDVTADVYPYIRNGIGLGSFLHPRHYARGEDVFLATLGDPAVRRELRKEVEETSDWENWYRHVGKDWRNVLVTRSTDPEVVGSSIQEAAERKGLEPWDLAFDLIRAGGTGVAPESMNEEQKQLAMRAPFVCFDNDAAPTDPTQVASAHPRAFGAFPRVVARYVREENVISLPEAIRKLTSLPAEILHLEDRGRIATGLAADVIVFHPDEFRDTATFTDPLSYSVGLDHVIVNGTLVIESGEATGALPGRVLRHGR